MTAQAERVLGILLGVAAHRGTITYGALHKLLGLKVEWRQHRAQVGALLNEVGDYTYIEWGLILPVLAVGKGNNLPSGGYKDGEKPGGFWLWCQENDLDTSDRYQFVMDEQRKVYGQFALWTD